MDNILRGLKAAQVAVDLGCGGGSFHYASYQCRIIGVDVFLNPRSLCRDGSRIQYLRSKASELPLLSGSVDAFICNHTFEHFVDYKRTLAEIDRVLKPHGMLWIAIPDGHSFDDFLYRLIFDGGGHCNRFTHDGLIEDVQRHTDLKLVQSISLFSGFVYLKKPAREQCPYLPSRAKFLYYAPDHFNRAVIFAMNAITRLVDKLFGSRISQYGWGFVFARRTVDLDWLPSYFNVCWKCGSGNPAEHLKLSGRVKRVFGIRLFCCSNCEAKNIFLEPPIGLS